MVKIKNNNKSRKELRFEREAKALQKNLQKRKLQQALRDQQKQEMTNGQDKN